MCFRQMSYVKMLSIRWIWNNQIRFPTVADKMARNRFDNIRSYFLVSDNTDMLPREHKDHN